LAAFTFKSYVNNHHQEFEEVVNLGTAKERACLRDPDLPGSAIDTVASKAKWASVGPADAGQGPDDD
jgi:hypothetical protein